MEVFCVMKHPSDNGEPELIEIYELEYVAKEYTTTMNASLPDVLYYVDQWEVRG